MEYTYLVFIVILIISIVLYSNAYNMMIFSPWDCVSIGLIKRCTFPFALVSSAVFMGSPFVL